MAAGQAEARTTYRREILRIDDPAVVSSRKRPTTAVIRKCEKGRPSFPLLLLFLLYFCFLTDSERKRGVRCETNRRNGRKRNDDLGGGCDPPSSPLPAVTGKAPRDDERRASGNAPARFDIHV